MKSPIIYLLKPFLWEGRYHETYGQFLNVGYERAIALDNKGIGYAVANVPDYVDLYRHSEDLDDKCLEILEKFFFAVLNFPEFMKDESWERVVNFIYFIKKDNLEQMAAFLAGGPVPPKDTKPKRVRKKKTDLKIEEKNGEI